MVQSRYNEQDHEIKKIKGGIKVRGKIKKKTTIFSGYIFFEKKMFVALSASSSHCIGRGVSFES